MNNYYLEMESLIDSSGFNVNVCYNGLVVNDRYLIETNRTNYTNCTNDNFQLEE